MMEYERLGRPTRSEFEVAAQGGDITALSPALIHSERATSDLPRLIEFAAKSKDTPLLIAIGFAAAVACDSEIMSAETIEAYKRVKDTALDLLLFV